MMPDSQWEQISFMAVLGCLFVAAVILGHGALHVYLHNRINSTGLRRKVLKRIEKTSLLHFVLLPAVLLPLDGTHAIRMLGDLRFFQELTFYSKIYSVGMVVCLVALLPRWIVGRVEYWRQRKYRDCIKTRTIDAQQLVGDKLFKPSWLRRLSRLPGNQVSLIEISTKTLEVSNLHPAWSGVKIAHLSDLHLIGWYDDRFTRLAIQELEKLKPDLCVLSGDIVDRESCIDSLSRIFSGIQAPLGCYFVLGNHDTRVSDPDQVRQSLIDVGWIDLGQSCHEVDDSKNHRVLQLLGNERPWFDLQSRNISERELLSQLPSAGLLRIGVSHSPDQWPWAIECQCQIVFCGHTHGGQIRLPVIGPVISPSWQGSRYASGIFERSNCMMHVSRGLSGTQPVRINCKPEVSLIVLHAKGSSI